jgi:NmrA-like family
MSHPILVTGAAGGTQGSTGRLVASLLLEQGIPVRALVHKLDSRSDELHQQGAEVVEGDLLNPASVQAALRNVKRAYFTYPVADAPTTDVLDLTGRPAEDFETIARRYATLPGNQRTFSNWLRTVTQFLITPLSPGFNFERYDRELRRPFPSDPEFAPDSKVWQREHAIADAGKTTVPRRDNARPAATNRVQSLEF